MFFSDINLDIIVNIISIFITLGMTCATFSMAKSTKKMVDAQSKPHVVVYAQNMDGGKNNKHHIELVIENIGFGPAYDIKFKCSDNLMSNCYGMNKEESTAHNSFNSGPLVVGIPYLPPNKKRVLNWGQFGGILHSLKGEPAEIFSQFLDADGKKFSTKNFLDIKDFEKTSAHESLELRQTKALETIPINVKALNSIIEKKLRSQNPEESYMWAYTVWKLLKKNGFPLEEIYRCGEGAGLTSEQMLNAEKQANSLLRHYRPELVQDDEEE